jgi:hypothetical protein
MLRGKGKRRRRGRVGRWGGGGGGWGRWGGNPDPNLELQTPNLEPNPQPLIPIPV